MLRDFVLDATSRVPHHLPLEKNSVKLLLVAILLRGDLFLSQVRDTSASDSFMTWCCFFGNFNNAIYYDLAHCAATARPSAVSHNQQNLTEEARNRQNEHSA